MTKKHLRLYFILLFLFLLGNYNGYIALWNSSSPLPYHVFPYSVSMLPRADQLMLNVGIEISSNTELCNILEDYLS